MNYDNLDFKSLTGIKVEDPLSQSLEGLVQVKTGMGGGESCQDDVGVNCLFGKFLI